MIPEECYAAAFEEIVSECGGIRGISHGIQNQKSGFGR